MKIGILMALAGLLLMPLVAYAGPTEAQVFAQCKSQAKQVFGDDARVRLKRLRRETAQLVVTPKSGGRRTVVCKLGEEKGAQLTYRDGSPIQVLSKAD